LVAPAAQSVEQTRSKAGRGCRIVRRSALGPSRADIAGADSRPSTGADRSGRWHAAA